MPQIRSASTLATLLAACTVAGCASTQNVRIECVPRQVQLYVDGRLLEGNEASLRTDRAHKIYAKGPGYEPRLVVLEPEVGEDGRAGFRDEDLCIEVVPIGMGREIELDVERTPGAQTPPS